LLPLNKQGVDGRDKPGHDEWGRWFNMTGIRSSAARRINACSEKAISGCGSWASGA
jgi:hypothetical protein